MIIHIRPTENYIQKDYDFDEDNDGALFLSGYEIEERKIEDGGTFVVPKDYIGIIQDEDDYFYEPDSDFDHSEKLVETLNSGKYRLKGHYIVVL